jgi:hypothetical protein
MFDVREDKQRRKSSVKAMNESTKYSSEYANLKPGLELVKQNPIFH